MSKKSNLYLCAIIGISLMLFVPGCDEVGTDSEVSTVTLNLNVPADEDLNDVTAIASLWANWDDNEPYLIGDATISANAATITMEDVAEGTYYILVVLDTPWGDQYDDDEDCPVHPLDRFWGGLSIEVDEDLSITISEDEWQTYHSIVFGLEDIPSGHNGDVVAIAVMEDGADIADFDFQPLLGGLGLVNNNSAFLAMNPSYDEFENDEDWLNWNLQDGDYDIWVLIDVDGEIEDYDDTTKTQVFTVGDLYFQQDFSYNSNYDDDMQLLAGDFSTIVGISGEVSCPQWQTGSGDIYILSFRENPLVFEDSSPIAGDVLQQPGEYELAMMPGDSAYVVGFWDADNSGDDDGPTQDDMIGGYGFNPDSITLECVHCPVLGIGDIDFVLDTPFDTTMMGSE